MIGNGKAVRLVADALQQVQRGAGPRQLDGRFPAGYIDQLVELGKADCRDKGQAKGVQNFRCNGQLRSAAVDDEQVRQRVKARVAVFRAGKAPGERLAHGGQVVAARVRADAEPAVGLPVRLAVRKYDHGGNRIAAL